MYPIKVTPGDWNIFCASYDSKTTMLIFVLNGLVLRNYPEPKTLTDAKFSLKKMYSKSYLGLYSRNDPPEVRQIMNTVSNQSTATWVVVNRSCPNGALDSGMRQFYG